MHEIVSEKEHGHFQVPHASSSSPHNCIRDIRYCHQTNGYQQESEMELMHKKCNKKVMVIHK